MCRCGSTSPLYFLFLMYFRLVLIYLHCQKSHLERCFRQTGQRSGSLDECVIERMAEKSQDFTDFGSRIDGKYFQILFLYFFSACRNMQVKKSVIAIWPQ